LAAWRQEASPLSPPFPASPPRPPSPPWFTWVLRDAISFSLPWAFDCCEAAELLELLRD
jgi:hypothetical protein